MKHAAFTVERRYAFAPALVFDAYTDPGARERWLVNGEGFTVEAYEPGFGVGSFERSRFRFQGGPLVSNDTVYHDIVFPERLVFSYSMAMEDAHMSASLVTVEFRPDGTGTTLVHHEQAAFVEAYADPLGREEGVRELMAALEVELRTW
jgi:uncharacterized protein YndB with AHSA1/START domain